MGASTESSRPRGAAIGIMAIAGIAMALGTIQPGMAMLFGVYSDVPMTTIMYIISLPSLTCLIGTFIAGIIAGRFIKYRTLALLAGIVWVITGVLPGFVYGFEVLLVTRCIYTFAMGMLMPLYNPLINALYSEDKQARMLSIATFVAYGGTMVLQLVGGFLADIQWNFIFFTHFLGVIAVVLMIFVPEPPKEAMTERKKTEKGALPARVVVMGVFFAVMGLCMMPVLFNYSVLVAAIDDSVAVAATVQLFYSIGCMVGGLLFATFFKLFKRFTIGVAALLVAVGQLLLVMSGNVPLMCAAMFIAGFGYCMIMPAVLHIAGLVTKPSLLPFATSIIMILMNVTSFIATPFITMVAGFAGGDAIFAPIWTCIIIVAVLAVATLVVNPFPKSASAEQSEAVDKAA